MAGAITEASSPTEIIGSSDAISNQNEEVPTLKQEEDAVSTVISKRLRAFKKKANRIASIEEAILKGKPINKEQEDVLRSKISVLSVIDELEKLRGPVKIAVKEEVDEAEKRTMLTVLEKQSAGKGALEGEAQSIGQKDVNLDDLETSESKLRYQGADLLSFIQLLYFGSLFGLKSAESDTSRNSRERASFLSESSSLSEDDLDAISSFSSLFSSLSENFKSSHEENVSLLYGHFNRWIENSSLVGEEATQLSYADLREKLEKIASSQFYKLTPVEEEKALEAEPQAKEEISFGTSEFSSIQDAPVLPPQFPNESEDVNNVQIPVNPEELKSAEEEASEPQNNNSGGVFTQVNSQRNLKSGNGPRQHHPANQGAPRGRGGSSGGRGRGGFGRSSRGRGASRGSGFGQQNGGFRGGQPRGRGTHRGGGVGGGGGGGGRVQGVNGGVNNAPN